ncbi:mfs transporter [Stylonychia lemnae]|uniref:Mfs transporter n=1 Tax=Stylonychia lemnae TaxID=5949 RepID=A0A078ATK5_STYLE|nr:mfs transporter [Stylonychia lemnae]|eukprot:CDW84532.1 mfs transporter [Stylonychia lemnae]
MKYSNESKPLQKSKLTEKLISSENFPDPEKQSEIQPITVLGIRLKRRFTKINLLAIPYLFFTIAIVASFINTQMIFILRHEDYFNVPINQLGTVTSDMMFYMQLSSIILSLFIGYIFDMFGRKIPIFISILVCGFLMACIPQTAPTVYPTLILVRILIGLLMIAPNCHPLVSDYVSKPFRGRVTGYQSYGQIFGEFFTYAVLFNIQMENFKISYLVVGLFISCLSIPALVMIKEHRRTKTEKIAEISHPVREDCCQSRGGGIFARFMCLTRVLKSECQENIILPLTFFGVFIIKQSSVLYNTFLILRITSYVDKGILENDLQARQIVQMIKIYQVFASLFLIVFTGHYSDKFQYRITIPIAFTIKASVIFLLIFLDNPNSFLFQLCCIAIQSFSLIQNILIDGLFSKNLKKEIRGTLNGVYYFFGSLGMLLYAKLGGYLYDNVSQDTPFYIASGLNVAFGTLVLILSLTKTFKH